MKKQQQLTWCFLPGEKNESREVSEHSIPNKWRFLLAKYQVHLKVLDMLIYKSVQLSINAIIIVECLCCENMFYEIHSFIDLV